MDEFQSELEVFYTFPNEIYTAPNFDKIIRMLVQRENSFHQIFYQKLGEYINQSSQLCLGASIVRSKVKDVLACIQSLCFKDLKWDMG